MNKNPVIILLFVLVACSIGSCNKSGSYSPPVINILAPAENEAVQLPGFVEVQVSVAGEQTLKYVRISIDNDQLTPMFTSKFFYPDSNLVVINYDFQLDQIPHGQSGPFYLHIAVDDGIEINHEYRKVKLNNADMVYKGFYLFSQPMPNRIQIDYYDTDARNQYFEMLDGDYVDSDVSAKQDMVYISTNKPSALFAFEFNDQNLQWAKEPLNPYPEYTDLLHEGSNLYSATGNGQISNLSDVSGFVKVITPVLPDSVPAKIGVCEDFFIGDFWVRNKPARSWVIFYKVTGQIFHRNSSDIQVIDFYAIGRSNGFSVLGNKDAKGIYLKYLIEEQSTSDSFVFTDGEISNTYKMNENEFLVAIDRHLYVFNVADKSTKVIHEFSSEIVAINFDSINSNLFVALENTLEIFAYPSMIELNAIHTQHPIKGLELRFAY